jgi:hypothetical protein
MQTGFDAGKDGPKRAICPGFVLLLDADRLKNEPLIKSDHAL